MLGLPVPQIVLAEDTNAKGRFIVLDGKQRLTTLKQFAAPDEEFASLRLRNLEFLPQLNGMTFEQLQSSPLGLEFSESLLAQPVRTIVVRNWRKPPVLYQIFVRLNQNSVALSPQELRQALYPGEFTTWINERSRDSIQIHEARRMKHEDFRMRDAEMLLRYVALSLHLENYSGNLRQFLDDACIIGNRTWDQSRVECLILADQCEHSIAVTQKIFDKDSFMRATRDGYIRRFNIAVFDAMTLVFSSAQITLDDIDQSKASSLRARFESLCTDNDWFREAIVSSTKTPRNTFGRLLIWGRAVRETFDKDVPIVNRAELLVDPPE